MTRVSTSLPIPCIHALVPLERSRGTRVRPYVGGTNEDPGDWTVPHHRGPMPATSEIPSLRCRQPTENSVFHVGVECVTQTLRTHWAPATYRLRRHRLTEARTDFGRGEEQFRVSAFDAALSQISPFHETPALHVVGHIVTDSAFRVVSIHVQPRQGVTTPLHRRLPSRGGRGRLCSGCGVRHEAPSACLRPSRLPSSW